MGRRHQPHVVVRTIAKRPLLRRTLRPIAAFAVVVAAGIVGFSRLDGVGLVDAAFWLLDPTSIELHFQAHDGPARVVKAYAVAVLSGLVVTGIWIGETAVSATFGGRIRTELERMNHDRHIDALDDHVIVCGYGTFGRTIAAGLRADDRDVVVVEHDDAQYQRALDDELLAVNDDARRAETLTRAGVERAATVVGAIDDSKENVQIAIEADELSPTTELVVRAGDATDEALARRAGADDVIVPEIVSGEQVRKSL
ncbi:NAD(P)-binding protein [Halopenitus sp. POP-27]|uniref:potassium channel family protein n=1 Tax=Halopenitus sp. POP-27 TaxID=2994425 RepID=UPI002468A507|nr:NAD(P)-binding protein [Halopenitus sp. POP-27]